ncbi:hypothetical protein Cgig2_031142 [Carnegiea gigantea]|uniref:FLZ-type domain-containing protein n=1 Tax=Carnegiea gigantea TaxID=171969 RepID=A0A9Q1KPX2_9CARY|nr:hypothetical protein Cgig2_031142 [Carnegiea gigantea]
MVSEARQENNQLGILLTGHGAGLGILAQIYSHSHVESSDYSNNVVLKSGLRSLTTTPIITNYDPSTILSFSSSSSSSVIRSCINVNDGDYYKLKSCHSCTKPLRPDQDIYMYRGDEGFCSEECRNRQIMLDERKEKESAQLAKKKMAAASISTTDCRGCETCRLLEDLRRRRRRRQNDNKPKHQPILSIS